jgi:hypothetical protein
LYSWAIVPTGLVLSLLAVVLLLFTGWKGGEMVYRHRVGISNTPKRGRHRWARRPGVLRENYHRRGLGRTPKSL